MDAAGHALLLPAITAANARPGAETILVPNGTIRLTIAGADEDAARGDLDSRLDLAPPTADRAGPGCPSVSPRTPPRPASRRNKKTNGHVITIRPS
jgi:hypothetical protein